MKKLFPLLFSLFSLSAFATHERAGEITYRYLGGYTYEITVTTYSKPESFMADRCMITIRFGDGDSAVVCRSNYESGDPASDPWGASGCTNNSVCSTHHMGEWSILSPCMDSKRNVFTTTHTFSGSWTYVISCTDPNRVSDIINIPPNTSLSLSDTLIINPFIADNSSPVFNNLPLDTAHVGIGHIYNPGATDPDGDSLSYELVPCEDNPGHPISGYWVPFGVSLNSVSGDLIWNSPPNLISYWSPPDVYNFAVRIKEWRKIGNNFIRIGTVTRDVQILVEACAGLSVNDIDSNLPTITISPNPFSTQTILQIDNILKNATLTIYNFFGQTVKEIKNISGWTITLFRDNFPSGLYLLRLTQDSKAIATEKLVTTDK